MILLINIVTLPVLALFAWEVQDAGSATRGRVGFDWTQQRVDKVRLSTRERCWSLVVANTVPSRVRVNYFLS
jgi:hypothetical protein